MTPQSYAYAETPGEEHGPLFLTFHGTGGDETQFHRLASQLKPRTHVISPRGDVSEYGAARFFKRTGEGVYDMVDLAARTSKMAGFVAGHKKRLAPSEVVGLGYSNGANILASVLFERPELIDRAVLLHPLIPWRPDPNPGLAGKQVLITAGRQDPICPPDMTRALAEYLRDQGADVAEVWHDGGHDIRAEEIEAALSFLS